MLPSTGYFKGINCPFYDNGMCERRYCHFRHVKKEFQGVSNEGIENGVILQQLVSEAVKKVLEQTEVNTGTKPGDSSVAVTNEMIVTHFPQKVTYNPTPISELQKINNIDSENEINDEQRKRHIPVPYTPRKPVALNVKKPISSNGEVKPFIYNPPPLKYMPGSAETPILDPYLPEGGTESKEKYLPGTEAELQEYKPVDTKTSSKINYVPSDKSYNKKKTLEYKPAKVNSLNMPSVTYQPTPLSQVPCFSSDEDEPDSKKIRLSADLNGLDELGAEFDMLGQILDEEKAKDNLIKKFTEGTITKEKVKEIKSAGKHDKSTKHKASSTEKHDKKKSKQKDKHRSTSHEKHGQNDSKSKSSDKKSSHKSSSKDKEKIRDKNEEKRKVSSTKNVEKDAKRSEKHSSSSKKSSKEKHESSQSKSRHKEKSKSKNSKEKISSTKSKDKSKHNPKEIICNVSDNEDFFDQNNINENLSDQISESDEEAIALECKRIFEEYVPSAKPQVIEEQQLRDENNSNEYIPTKKRISHTIGKDIKVLPKEPLKPDFKVSAAQKMAERLAKVREYHAAKKAAMNDPMTTQKDTSKNILPQPTTSGKIRIAHVPYAYTMLNAKKIIPLKPQNIVEPSTSTITQTVKKGSSRVAHMPNEKFIDRPGVLEPLASRIPANVRSTFLNMMIDECIKIYLTPADAYARAQYEELATSKKCKAIQIYKNSAVLTVNRLRKELQECNGIKKSSSDCTALQKIPSAISGTSGSTGSWSIENKSKRYGDTSHEFVGAKFYSNISKWILTEEQLQDNGFPRPHPNGEKGRALITNENKKQKPPKGFFRTCCRCSKEYTVDKKNFPVIKEECIYHPNRKYRFRGEVRYQCCSQDGTSDGCCVAPSHVFEYVDYDNLRGFVRTLPSEKCTDDYGVYALDCEMCYTTHGLDLTRITVINSDCRVVYETLIKPLHPIIDYNTRYSGITEEQMTNVSTTLLEVQATLLTMFNNKTILIGHSLESDFKALKLIHETVIDTSVLFPHKMGPPYKRALRNLSSEYLKKIIQNSVEGHDSAEDATVCMELIHYKLKEELKMR